MLFNRPAAEAAGVRSVAVVADNRKLTREAGINTGAVLIQTIENGLNILNVNPYLYPIITSGVIFVAVLLDAVRNRVLARANRRRIFVETETA